MSPASHVLTLSASLLVWSACGTEHIELRPGLGGGASLPAETLEPAVSSEVPSASDLGGDAVARDVPSRDGILISGNPLSNALPPVEEGGCQKVDFLFVIDNSSSMDDEQANLIGSFPAFIQVMQQVLEASDFHIMVVSTGGKRQHEDDPALDPRACEEVQGAGRRSNPDGVDCGFQGGLPYMSKGQPDLEAAFSCVARVGTDGSAIEEPMDAVLAATSDALNAGGRCNAGFLRDDAILVVTVITDEEDRRSTGDPEDWRRLLVETKNGNPDALVMLGLVGDNNVDGGLLGGQCRAFDADGAPRLQELVSSLDGVLGSVCAVDYTPFFQTAAGSIDSACSDFAPPPPL